MAGPKNKQDYRNLCEKYQNIPLFIQDWWLDVLCGEETWEVLMARNKDGSVRGAWPYWSTRRLFWSIIRPPALSPYGGIWFNYPPNLSGKDAFEKKVINELLEALPETAFLIQDFKPSWTNWLPFYWKNFRQTTFYTYRIENPWETKKVFDNFESSVRNKIRKAQKQLVVREGSLEEFYSLNEQTFQRQGMTVPYSMDLLKKLDRALALRKQRHIFIASDQEGRNHAGLYLVWDQQTAYNLMLGANPKLRSSGAVQLLMWEAIQVAGAKRLHFDFEGSMLPAIEPLFRSFGGEQQPYFRIYKASNRLFYLAKELWAKW